MAATVGVLAKMGWGSTSTVDKPMEFLSESIRKSMQIQETGGIRGTRSHVTERTRRGPYTVSGSISMSPSPVELDTILRYVTGTAKNGSSQFPLAETIEEFYVSVARESGTPKVFHYAGCKIARARLSSAEGQLLQVQLDIEGKTESVNTTYPSLTLDTGAPYCFYDAAVTIGGTTYQVREWSVDIDNHLAPRHLNSETRTDIPATDRTVACNLVLPYTSNEFTLYDVGNTGAAVVITLTNGTVSLTISMADVKFNTESPTVGGKDEVFFALNGMAHKTGSTAELVLTNDSTP